jgi:hypothetical protein
VLRRTQGVQKSLQQEDGEKLHNAKLHNYYSSSYNWDSEFEEETKAA